MSENSIAGAHTPGPWGATNGTGPTMQSYSQPSAVHGEGDHRMQIICGCFGDIGGPDVAAANARLIAAAPDMLAALQAMSAHYSGSLDHQPAYVKMGRAAIARATGVQP